MIVSKISIKNILGLESLEIEPGVITEISGQNGAGKTSCLEAIKAALGSGHDATLLRKGAEEGEVVLVLEDGTEIKRRVTEAKTDTVVSHPVYGKISRPASYLKKLSDALSVNPVQFLTADKKTRITQLLQAIPMQVTADQLGFVPVSALQGVSLDAHALEAIGAISKNVYDTRTGVNRSQKDKEATARQMRETLPSEQPKDGKTWKDELDFTVAELNKLRSETKAAVDTIDDETALSLDTAKVRRDKRVEAIKAALEAEIEKLRIEAQADIDTTAKEYEEIRDAAAALGKAKVTELENDYRPKEAEMKEAIGRLQEKVEGETKAEAARIYIAKLDQESKELAAESTRLTDALTSLDRLKANLLADLPISGLEVKDGDIYVDGVPFDRVNTSKRVMIAIQVAQMQASDLKLICVDGLEALDDEHYQAFKDAAKGSGLQFVVGRVSSEPLTITREEAVA